MSVGCGKGLSEFICKFTNVMEGESVGIGELLNLLTETVINVTLNIKKSRKIIS